MPHARHHSLPSSNQLFDQFQFITHQTWRQKVFTHMFTGSPTKRSPFTGMVQKMDDFFGTFFFIILNQVLMILLWILHRNASGFSRHHRFFFPKGFRDNQTESFPDRVLNHDVAPALKHIDLGITDTTQICKNKNIGILKGFLFDLIHSGSHQLVHTRHGWKLQPKHQRKPHQTPNQKREAA